MSMRRAIGVSLACLAISATAGAKAGERAAPTEGPPDSMYAAGQTQVGKAAWYNWVGLRTASGEILDRVTATAAHRSLPLASYAKVTNLDTGRAVIVKINDRGPYRRRFIIDLSPRAAEEIGVIGSGIAAVAVEPLAARRAARIETGPQSEIRVTRAEASAIPHTQAAWVDPRLEQSTAGNGTATAPEGRAASADSAPLSYTQPAFVDPRLDQPAPSSEPATTSDARTARADSAPIPYTEAAWIDQRIAQPQPSNEAASWPEMRVARADSEALPLSQPAWIDPRLEQQ
jgi:rare lipoprotein A